MTVNGTNQLLYYKQLYTIGNALLTQLYTHKYKTHDWRVAISINYKKKKTIDNYRFKTIN